MGVQAKAGFLDRTLRNIWKGWQSIAGENYSAEQASSRPSLPDEDLARVRNQMGACLEGRGGEVSARARAAALGHVYLALDETGKERFLRTLNDEFNISKDAVDEAIKEFQNADNTKDYTRAETNLRQSLESHRLKLLLQFNALPDGVKFLVDMRAMLLRLTRQDITMLPLEQDLKYLLRSWFDVGFLELRRITWNFTSAALMEKLIAYEAVHMIQSWDDLKNRLDSDRRCFAYFHPKMPEEPLIFVEVALVSGLAGNVQMLLDEEAPLQDPETADTAIFYSISNAQKGLSGISFGNFLIKRVVTELSGEFKGLKTFSTLSPIPGFIEWLENIFSDDCNGLLNVSDRHTLNEAMGSVKARQNRLSSFFSEHAWTEDESLNAKLKPILLRTVAHYLVVEKNKNDKAIDPVAHFHLTNGAVVERLNWLGDTSNKGLKQSAGIMINYVYDLATIDINHEAYADGGKITASSDILSLL
tara:strand:+ start:882 stop:2303 length:1422 start_codon:yes stop_codon:yes gene_type:complete